MNLKDFVSSYFVVVKVQSLQRKDSLQLLNLEGDCDNRGFLCMPVRN